MDKKNGFTQIPNFLLEELLKMTLVEKNLALHLFRETIGRKNQANFKGYLTTMYKLSKAINHSWINTRKALDTLVLEKLWFLKDYSSQKAIDNKTLCVLINYNYSISETIDPSSSETIVPPKKDNEIKDLQPVKKEKEIKETSTTENDFEINELSAIMKHSKCNKYFNPTKNSMQKVTDLLSYGRNVCSEAIKICDDLDSIPNNPFAYTYGIAKKLYEKKLLEREVNTPKETKEFEAHLIELPKLIEKFGNNGVPEHKEHLEFIEQCKSVRETQDYFDISFIKQKNKQLTEIAEIYIEMRKKC